MADKCWLFFMGRLKRELHKIKFHSIICKIKKINFVKISLIFIRPLHQYWEVKDVFVRRINDLCHIKFDADEKLNYIRNNPNFNYRIGR